MGGWIRRSGRVRPGRLIGRARRDKMVTWGPLVEAGPTTQEATRESEVIGAIALPGWCPFRWWRNAMPLPVFPFVKKLRSGQQFSFVKRYR